MRVNVRTWAISVQQHHERLADRYASKAATYEGRLSSACPALSPLLISRVIEMRARAEQERLIAALYENAAVKVDPELAADLEAVAVA